MPSITAWEKNTHLGTNLTKESQDLCPQIAFPREIKDNLHKSDLCHVYVSEDNSVKVNGRENSCENDLWIQCIPNQIPSSFFFLLKTEIGKLLLNYIWITKIQEQPYKTKKQDFWGLLRPDSKTNYDTIIIKIVWYEHENRQIGQRHKEKGPRTDSHKHGHHIYNN